ncbi:hypothetical protein N7476_011593 [Penicillium atrosanguineum]|uniref:FAD-binding domain-containing protein n=1 Tax=Penicillium atrosanguineum TaxID=1132637 RepID=A0A9W9TZP5_9EURO|nr:hypothetical protein N7476_011593 [Penicillium atrosanguineum]
MKKTVIDGVQRYPTNGLKVLVIGAGTSGMQTALECWRKGCEVEIIEKADELSPIGDYFTITPSAQTTLKDYPSMYVQYHNRVYDCILSVFAPGGDCIGYEVVEWNRSNDGHASPDVKISFLNRRPEYAQMQLDQLKRLAIPVHFSQKASSMSEVDNRVIVETETGKKFSGDICIAADGLGTVFRRREEPIRSDVMDSGYSIARCAFPTSHIKPDTPAWKLVETVKEQPEFRIYLADDLHLILYLTADYVGIALTHPDDTGADESWSNLRDPAVLIKVLEKSAATWDPAVVSFMKQVPVKVVDWKLKWRDVNPSWTSASGRILAVGDAAHSFLPTSGNGVTQAIEDALSIGECLRLGGRENAAWATKVHNKLRFERTSVLQLMGFVNRDEIHKADLSAIKKAGKSLDVGFFRLGRWTWNHNPEKYATDNFDACLAHLRDEKPFQNTNLPPGHVYKPWTLQEENERMAKGIQSDLKQNGDWSV